MAFWTVDVEKAEEMVSLYGLDEIRSSLLKLAAILHSPRPLPLFAGNVRLKKISEGYCIAARQKSQTDKWTNKIRSVTVTDLIQFKFWTTNWTASIGCEFILLCVRSNVLAVWLS